MIYPKPRFRSPRSRAPFSVPLARRRRRIAHLSTPARRLSDGIPLFASLVSRAHQDRSTPLVIDFFATWCGPCVLLASELEKVKAELGDAVRIVKVDTDEEAALSTQLQIQGLPTLVFVGTDTEKPALRTEGMLPAEMVKSIIANEL